MLLHNPRDCPTLWGDSIRKILAVLPNAKHGLTSGPLLLCLSSYQELSSPRFPHDCFFTSLDLGSKLLWDAPPPDHPKNAPYPRPALSFSFLLSSDAICVLVNLFTPVWINSQGMNKKMEDRELRHWSILTSGLLLIGFYAIFTALGERYPHFIDEETMALRGELICIRSDSQ